ncbi:S-methyl-5'-thioinosine phosphorylase [Thiococcus pfennigii]|jgi:5'-methylthioadenosine phosphorylase/5'-methylthioinosine phosphorylase|uniref:S-methyl-5'-thioinosine phosphorylase n=1 Tax=Thiococcus pfennigii TaxID=1057 RepID=UPI001907B866|nr:S-methyl-5'-thioinosine phosphorylase [Thiococcus pfennigii]MBK1699491.1 5'-methylthioadenosine phosphorylase [Thiococcus pfennigii]MBK1730227.1 5'-methylthioadenosine phosphorylase [Thiococcus pfennigii]
MGRLAIIGGSGFKAIRGIEGAVAGASTTPYGPPSAPVSRALLGEHEVLFLPRHGVGHTIPPHRINYRANLWALREAGASHIVGLGAVGGITPAFGPCVLAVPDQLIDYTYGRVQTYHDNDDGEVVHIDFSAPYCASLREDLRRAAESSGVEIVAHAVYGATQGPRLETAAEVRRLERDGCDLVGMTGMPEAALARELGLCYASLAFVVNWAAGKVEGEIQMSEIAANVALCTGRIEQILTALTPSGA